MNKNNWGIILFLLFFIFIILPIILNLVGIKPTEGLENKSNYIIMGQSDFPIDKINIPPDWPVDKPIYIPKNWPKNINYSVSHGIITPGTTTFMTGDTVIERKIMGYTDENNINHEIKDGIVLNMSIDEIEEYNKILDKYNQKEFDKAQQYYNGTPMFNFNNGMNNGMPPNTIPQMNNIMYPYNNTMPPNTMSQMNNGMLPMNNRMPPMNNGMQAMNNGMQPMNNGMPHMINGMPPMNNGIRRINNKLDFIIQKIK